jgi:glycosyltransferase involved in cell wall biosynthesis
MNILHICNVCNSPFSGINVVVPQHIQAQSRLCDVSVLNLCNKKVDCSARQISLEELYLPEFRADVVVFHGVYFLKYVQIAKYLVKKRIPYVVVPHCSLTKVSLAQKRIKKFFANLIIFSRFLRRSAAIQFLTDNEKETSIFSDKGFVCGNGVSFPAQKKSWDENNQCKRFVYIGRLDIFHKGIDILFDSFELEKAFLMNRKVQLDVYGPKQMKTHRKNSDAHEIIKKMIADRGLEQIIHVHDAVFGKEKENALIQSDVFIQTSRFEGLPLGILEALAAGMPCLVTEGTNTADLINKYKAGWGVETTPKKIAKAIKFAVLNTSNEQLENMSNAAIRLIADNFTWEKIAKKEISCYDIKIKELIMQD